MKIAIIAAMRKELDLILSQLGDYKESSLDGTPVYEGREGDNEYVITQCGIGKVNAALRTQRIIDRYLPDMVINSGVAGSVDDQMEIGSVLIADKVAYHDVWCGPGTEQGHADNCPLYFTASSDGVEILRKVSEDSDADIHVGLLCSGDRFISRPEEVEEIKEKFPCALGCDMESAAIAHTCYRNNVPFLIIRVTSDRPGSGKNIEEYTDFWTDAPARTFQILSYYLAQV